MRLKRAYLLDVLSRHIGRRNGVTASALVDELRARGIDTNARDLRECVVSLRNDGYHVCAHPSDGYYLAENDEELNQTCLFLYDRAMTSLTQVSRMKGISLPDLRGQLKLPT